MQSKAVIVVVLAALLSLGRAQSSAYSSFSSSSSSSSSTATTSPAPTPPPPTIPPPSIVQPPLPPVPSTTLSLPQFANITLCAPINLVIAKNTTNGFALTISAEENVIPNIQATVEGDRMLSISANGNFSTNRVIQLTATLPPQALRSIVHNGPGSSIYVTPGFILPTLDISTGFGAGSLYMDHVNITDKLSVVHHGIGNVVVTGNISTVNAVSDSLSPLTLSGVENSTMLTLSSTANVYIDQAPGATINGSSTGINKVYYTRGSCQITSPFSPFSNLILTGLQSCVLQAFVLVPPPQIQWTCGLIIQGNFTCQPELSIISLGSSGTSVSQTTSGTTLTSTQPGMFVLQGPTPTGGGFQQQAGTAQPGSATSQAGIAGTGSISATSSSFTGPGGSQSSTMTSQNGVSTVRMVSLGEGGSAATTAASSGGTPPGTSGVTVEYQAPQAEPSGTATAMINTSRATATNQQCMDPIDATRVNVGV